MFNHGQRVKLKAWVSRSHLKVLDLRPSDLGSELYISDKYAVTGLGYHGLCRMVMDRNHGREWIIKQCYLELWDSGRSHA